MANPAEAPLPLLLLPGTLCDARVFAPLQQRLRGIHTSVVLTPEARTMPEAARDVLAQAPPRFALLGFSLGGMVAMETALQAPQRVCGLALLSTTPLPVDPGRHSTRRAAVDTARTHGLAHCVRQHLWPDYASPAATPTSLPLLEAMADSLGHDTFARQTELALGRSDFRPRLPAIACPTLVLAGTDDRVCPPEAQQQLANAIAGSTCLLLPGSGHLALLEKPDEVAAAVAAWFHTVRQPSPHPSHNATGPTVAKEME